MNLVPSKFKRLYHSAHPAATEEQARKVTAIFAKKRRKTLIPGLPSTVSRSSKAAVVNYLMQLNTLEEAKEPDDVFLCAGGNNNQHWLLQQAPINNNESTTSSVKLVCVFSTEELLLNAYRQYYHSGQRNISFQIDASYRYTSEKRVGYIPIKVASICQVGHAVAYAVVTFEDQTAHDFILRAVKYSIEYVVNRRVKAGHKFC